MPENLFAERYKTLANWELWDILQNRGDYQKAAIEAAEFELQSRKLPEEAIAEAKEFVKKRSAYQFQKITQAKEKRERFIYSLNPLKKTFSTLDTSEIRDILLIALTPAFALVYSMISLIPYISFAVAYSTLDINSIIMLLTPLFCLY